MSTLSSTRYPFAREDDVQDFLDRAKTRHGFTTLSARSEDLADLAVARLVSERSSQVGYICLIAPGDLEASFIDDPAQPALRRLKYPVKVLVWEASGERSTRGMKASAMVERILDGRVPYDHLALEFVLAGGPPPPREATQPAVDLSLLWIILTRNVKLGDMQQQLAWEYFSLRSQLSRELTDEAKQKLERSLEATRGQLESLHRQMGLHGPEEMEGELFELPTGNCICGEPMADPASD